MKRANQPTVVVIGAGVGGLTTAALLVQAGYAVTVLEAHVYPGGSTGTFYHQGYRFDAGATLAGGFSPGGPHEQLSRKLGITWPVQPVDPAWVVHMPDGRRIHQHTDPAAWRTERRAHFPGSESFWEKQAMLAGLAWELSARFFPWPPENGAERLSAIFTVQRARAGNRHSQHQAGGRLHLPRPIHGWRFDGRDARTGRPAAFPLWRGWTAGASPEQEFDAP